MVNTNKCELIDYLQHANSKHGLHLSLNDRVANNSYCRHDRRKRLVVFNQPHRSSTTLNDRATNNVKRSCYTFTRSCRILFK